MFNFDFADDVQEMIREILEYSDLDHIIPDRVVCMRSTGSKSAAVARIWGLPRIWKKALSVDTHYVIEVISEKFDRMSREDKEKTLIHELMHIPKTFSGALVPHRCFGKKINKRSVERIHRNFLENRGSHSLKALS